MNQPSALPLTERSAAAVRKIPADRIYVFCASCAERFFDGYKRWTETEAPPALPSSEFVRRAVDVCWNKGLHSQADEVLRELIRLTPGENEQPIFKSPLSDYFVEPWLLQLGLSCVLDPKVSFGLQASAAALDFHWQLLILRRELGEPSPAFDDPEWDRVYEIDPGAVAESAAQIEDAEQLRLGVPDWNAMRRHSSGHGRHALGEVLRLLGSITP